MKNGIHIEIPEANIVRISYILDAPDRIVELILTIENPICGQYLIKVSKKNGKFVWYDKDAPIQKRNFDTLQSMMWEYSLPKSLEKEFEKLVEEQVW